MRCDVNISVRRAGETAFGTRTEIKNMNSINYIVKAINSEFERQIDCIESKEPIIQQTLRYNEVSNTTEPMRGKEDSNDYRYFREPDLPYVYISDEEISRLAAELPELFDEKEKRYVSEFALSEKDAAQITKYANIAAYFEKMVEISGAPKLCANVLLTQIFRYMEDDDAKEACSLPIEAEEIAKVIKMVDSGEISNNFIKKIVDKMFETGKPFDELFKKSDFAAADSSAVEPIIDRVIAENQKIADDFKSGKDKAISALIGKVMRETKGKADAKFVEATIREKLK